jgi:AcrR family transcriptional regulator
MRVRTEHRRSAILNAAIDVFREFGFERATVSTIMERLGSSKATLYSYFESKEDLFNAAILEALATLGDRTLHILDPQEPNYRLVLDEFSRAYLRLMGSKALLETLRLAIAEGAYLNLSASFYGQGLRRMLDGISVYMVHLVERGIIEASNPRMAALHFHGLLDAGIVQPLLFGAQPEFGYKEAARAAVDAFLRAYAPGRQAWPVDVVIDH